MKSIYSYNPKDYQDGDSDYYMTNGIDSMSIPRTEFDNPVYNSRPTSSRSSSGMYSGSGTTSYGGKGSSASSTSSPYDKLRSDKNPYSSIDDKEGDYAVPKGKGIFINYLCNFLSIFFQIFTTKSSISFQVLNENKVDIYMNLSIH